MDLIKHINKESKVYVVDMEYTFIKGTVHNLYTGEDYDKAIKIFDENVERKAVKSIVMYTKQISFIRKVSKE